MTTPRQCSKCLQLKPATLAYFPRNRASKDGLHSWCKDCLNADNRARYAAGREGQRERSRKRRADNPEAARAYAQKYYQKHKEEVLGRQRARRQANPEKERERNREYKRRNPDKVAEQKKRYRERYGERERERLRQLKARKRAEAQAARPPKPPKAPRPAPVPKPELILEPELKQAVSAFLAVKAMKKQRTHEWYKNVLHYLCEFLVTSNLPQWPPDPDLVNAFLADRKARGVKDSTLHNYYRAIAAWFKWLARRKKIDRDQLELLERPPETRLLPKVAKVEDVARLIEHLKRARGESWQNLRDYTMIILALDTGARIGELAAVKLVELDREQWTIAATGTKTGQDRTILYSASPAQALEEWLGVRSGLDLPEDLDAVFVSYSNRHKWRPWPDDGMRRALATWQDRAGISRFNFHRLRATYAVYTLRAGGDLLDVQKQMGHTNLATTQIYTRVDDTGRRERHNRANPLAYLGVQL